MAKKEQYIQVEPGIQQRVSDNKYVVWLDYGRQLKEDKKTGELKYKQVKTSKVVNTLREARALRGQNSKEKQHKKITGTTKKLAFSTVLEDYNSHKQHTWSDAYAMQKKAQSKRLLAYFGDRDVKSIDTIDVEEFFEWCRHEHENFPHPLGNNSINKIKSHMSDIWKFLKKNQNKYGIVENVVVDAEEGKIDEYEVTILSKEEVNTFIEAILKNENDYSAFTMVGCATLTGMRRSEICGLKWGDIDWENKIIRIDRGRVQSSTGSLEKLPKGEKKRISALPEPLAQMLLLVKEQQENFLNREVRADDYVYMQKTNLLNNYLPHPGKVSRRFRELQNRINKLRIKAGKELLPVVRLHDLRHTFISLCLNSGEVNPFQVSANVGHTCDDNTTTRIYWHDQGDRKEICEFIKSIITVEIKAYS